MKVHFLSFPFLVWEILESADTIRLVVEEGKELREAKKLNYPPVKGRILKV